MTKATEPFAVVLPAHLVALFVAAMACHAELARLRPHPRHLTTYYALIGLGGVIGGAFNTLLAPVLFEDWIEVPLAFTLVCLLIAGVRPDEADRAPRKAVERTDIVIPVALGLSTVSLVKLGDVFGASGCSAPIPRVRSRSGSGSSASGRVRCSPTRSRASAGPFSRSIRW